MMVDQPNCSEIVTRLPYTDAESKKAVLKRALDLLDAKLKVEYWPKCDKLEDIGMNVDKLSHIPIKQIIDIEDIDFSKDGLEVKDTAISVPPAFITTVVGVENTGVWFFLPNDDSVGFQINEWNTEDYEDFAKICSEFNSAIETRGGGTGDFLEWCDENGYDVNGRFI